MQKNTNINVPTSGMQRDKHPSNLNQGEYSFAMGAVLESEDGAVNMRQNEPSNILTTRFDGYKVVGYKNDINTNGTFFFVNDAVSGLSKILYLEQDGATQNLDDESGIIYGVDVTKLLSTPLENNPDRYTELYDGVRVILEDTEDNKCLNFDVHYPIRSIIIKDEQCGKSMYWTDNYNPPRYLNFQKLEEGWYFYHGEILCGDPSSVEHTSLACEKLRLFPLLDAPCIMVERIANGGSLRAGMYEFCIALCDQFGNETSNYYSLTNPVSIFDEANVVMNTSGEWGKNTGLGIRIDVGNIDSQSGYYKIAVIQHTVGFSGESQPVEEYFIEGVHPITEKTVYYTSDQNLIRTSLAHLSLQKPSYKLAKGLTTTQDRLVPYGLTVENEWNLQPMVNLLGSFLYWQTSYASEDLYTDGVAVSKYGNYMRDEIYPFGIRFLGSNGYSTSIFPLIPRPATDSESVVVIDENGNVIIPDNSKKKEIQSIIDNVPNCQEISRNKYWQFYNTAKEIGDAPGVNGKTSTCKEYYTGQERRSISYPYAKYPAGSLNLEVDIKEGDDVIDVINENILNLCNGDFEGVEDICAILNGKGNPDYLLTPFPEPEFPGGCDDVTKVEDDEISISDIVRTATKYTYKDAGNYIASDRSSLAAIRTEAQDKYDVLFHGIDPEIASKELNGDTETVDGYTIFSEIAEYYDLKNSDQCSSGCSCSSPLVDPSIFNNYIPSFEIPRKYDFPGTAVVNVQNDYSNGSSFRERSLHLIQELERLIDTWNITDSRFNELVYASSGSKYDTGIWEDKGKAGGSVSKEIDEYYYRLNVKASFFHRYLTKSAIWTRINRPKSWVKDENGNYADDAFIVVEFGGYNKFSSSDKGTSSSEDVRITFFRDCQGTVHQNPLDNNQKRGYKMNLREDKVVRMDPSHFKDDNGNDLDRLYVAVDSKIVILGYSYARKGSASAAGNGYSIVTSENPGKFMVNIREKEIVNIEVDFNSIDFTAISIYEATCTYCGDKDKSCEATPNRYGTFSYWESIRKYPANKQLYDSTVMAIDKDVVGEDIFNQLNSTYGLELGEDGLYHPSDKANFCQQPIRHYKFPDNTVAPFMSTATIPDGKPTIIYPLGIYISDDVVIKFLNSAVRSGLITQEQRDLITGYEIYGGDRKLNKSIQACGIAYDMWEYEDKSKKKVLYPNYPYNDLNDDWFIYSDETRKHLQRHPYGDGNTRFSFHSPDTHFNRVKLTDECVIEGYQTGFAKGCFPEVMNHPKWVILGSKSYSQANTYALLESAASAASRIAEMMSYPASNMYVGLLGANPVGIGISSAFSAIAVAAIGVSEYQMYGLRRYEWLNIFRNNGKLKNNAYYYTSVGSYNSFTLNTQSGNQVRGISVATYMDRGRWTSFDPGKNAETLLLNNIDREDSVFMSFGATSDYIHKYPSTIATFDNSRIVDYCNKGDDIRNNVVEYMSKIASPYIRMKNYIPDQYGDIDNVVWRSLGKCIKITEGENRYLFGGDCYISRMYVKRKMPYFQTTAFGQENLIPFAYNDYKNVAYPRFFVNYDIDEGEAQKSGSVFPNRLSSQVLNCESNRFYVDGKFYLYSYGIAGFLVESEINCNYRLAGPNKHEDFYPHVGDYVDWTQEKNVPIERDNYYFFHPVYNLHKHSIGWRTLPGTYDKKFYDCIYQLPSGYIWSQPDVTEANMYDPWLSFKPMNKGRFPTENGKLIHLKDIESAQILARFENQVALLNAVDIIRDRIDPNTAELGEGILFGGRPLNYNTTDLGYAGSQSVEILSNEFGHFWVDAIRGKMFKTLPNGRNLVEISPGISNWLMKNLPFKILRSKITNVVTGEPMTNDDVDNKFMSLGISMGWDNRYKRVFVTKRDYIPVKDAAYYKFDNGDFTYNDVPVSLHDLEYFKDVSFTVAYNCKKDEWGSYEPFMPDYYVEQMGIFQTGKNYAEDAQELGLWSHLVTQKSFQVFYGKMTPFIIEMAAKEEWVNKILASVNYRMESRRYLNSVDYVVHRNIGFDKLVLYNATNCSGQLILIPAREGDMQQQIQYPRVNLDSKQILVTLVYDKWNINDFSNDVIDDLSSTPIWIKDENDILKAVNPAAIDFDKKWKDRMRGDWMLVRYENSVNSMYKLVFRWAGTDQMVQKSSM